VTQITGSKRAGRLCQGCGASLTPSMGGPPRKWCSERCRKSQYSSPCVDCGGPTNGSDGRAKQSTRCATCAARHRHETRHWTRDALIAEVHRFNDIYGRPPRELDWNPRPSNLFKRTNQWRPAEAWPSSSLAPREFGSWNAMIAAAGYRPFDHALDHSWGAGRPLYREDAA
jgi:hypothetical protein